MVLEVLLLEKESYSLQRINYVANVTLKEFIGAKEGYGSEFAVPEVGVSRDIGAIQNDGQRRGFYGVFILGSWGDV